MSAMDEVKLVPKPSKEQLNERQLVDYEQHRTEMIQWMLHLGKDPEKAEGYALETVKARASRIDIFYRWVWEQEDGYTTNITPAHADEYTKKMAYSDYSEKYKANSVTALKMLFKWRHHELGEPMWEPEYTFNQNDGASQPRDYLTKEERKKIREAALEYGSIPSYSNLNSEQRDRWKTYLAQRFKKPKRDVSPDDWDRANSWKIPSMVWTSLDVGLRPIEVNRAVTRWVDIDNGVLRIPKEESSKNTENWIVPVQNRTVEALERWLDEREQYSLYDDTDTLWLTREGNPYRSQTLRYLLHKLCEIAGIDYTNRRMSWYAIRHSVGTGMANERGLAAAQQQLRHKSEQTTMKYDQAPVEERKEALNKMG